ncbi:MAG: hypothetical protein ACRCUI_03030 [Polymorphobacter sp.]
MTNRFNLFARNLIGAAGALLLATTFMVAAAGPAQVASAQKSPTVYLAA